MNTRIFKIKALAVFALLGLCSVNTSAASYAGAENFGTYLGTFSGIDSEYWFDRVFDLDATQLGEFVSPATTDGNLSIFNLVLNDDGDILSGEWSYTGPGVVTHLSLRIGSVFSLFIFEDGANSGFFETSTLGNKGIDSMAVYQIGAEVPLPAAVWLMLSGIAGLVGFRRRG